MAIAGALAEAGLVPASYCQISFLQFHFQGWDGAEGLVTAPGLPRDVEIVLGRATWLQQGTGAS